MSIPWSSALSKFNKQFNARRSGVCFFCLFQSEFLHSHFDNVHCTFVRSTLFHRSTEHSRQIAIFGKRDVFVHMNQIQVMVFFLFPTLMCAVHGLKWEQFEKLFYYWWWMTDCLESKLWMQYELFDLEVRFFSRPQCMEYDRYYILALNQICVEILKFYVYQFAN